ncbi:MAG: hypothetical protein JWM86_961, partial [Thermoleophilia bacterium]|nr:hypothetical protein [Thermoleophilia bacterium]
TMQAKTQYGKYKGSAQGDDGMGATNDPLYVLAGLDPQVNKIIAVEFYGGWEADHPDLTVTVHYDDPINSPVTLEGDAAVEYVRGGFKRLHVVLEPDASVPV